MCCRMNDFIGINYITEETLRSRELFMELSNSYVCVYLMTLNRYALKGLLFCWYIVSTYFFVACSVFQSVSVSGVWHHCLRGHLFKLWILLSLRDLFFFCVKPVFSILSRFAVNIEIETVCQNRNTHTEKMHWMLLHVTSLIANVSNNQWKRSTQ